MNVNLGGINLKNPVVAASGPLGHCVEFKDLIDFNSFGAIIVKGVSTDSWCGNPPPRIIETPSGMLNAVGLQNPGVSSFIKNTMPILAELDTQIIVNVIGKSISEYVSVVDALSAVKGIHGIEINISCPNLKTGGMSFGTDPDLTYCVVIAISRITDLPILVKLTPNASDIVAIAHAAQAAGADVISLINTLSGMAIDIETQKPILGNVVGGLSGPAIMPIALKMVWDISNAVNIPVLGMGGINSASDAIQFILAGARAIAIGSGLFYDFDLVNKVVDGIQSYMQKHKINCLSELEGAAKSFT